MTPVPQTVRGGRREELRARLVAIGFDEVRFAPVVDMTDGGLKQWIQDGFHSDMHWMERTAGKRADAGLVVSGAQTVVALAVNYWAGEEADSVNKHGGRPPVWARYALHEDYHDTIKRGLVAAGRVLEEFCGAGPDDYRCYVDTGPVMERGWAARAGIGFLGKNGMLISRRHGNWLFLAAIITRIPIDPDTPLRRQLPAGAGAEPPGLLCGKCDRCMTACPTEAIPRPGIVDARRCISYQTIENRGIIPRELRAGIGRRVFGCDVCLEVCPWNRFATEGRSVLLVARRELAGASLKELLAMTEAEFSRLFRGTAVRRLKHEGLLRNACVAAGNECHMDHLPQLVALASHDSPIVRAHAVWAAQRIAGRTGAVSGLAAARKAEDHPYVKAEYETGDAAPD